MIKAFIAIQCGFEDIGLDLETTKSTRHSCSYQTAQNSWMALKTDVRAMRVDVGDDFQDIAVFVDVESVVEHIFFAEGGVVVGIFKRGHQFDFIQRLFGAAEASAPKSVRRFEDDTIVDRAQVFVVLLQ